MAEWQKECIGILCPQVRVLYRVARELAIILIYNMTMFAWLLQGQIFGGVWVKLLSHILDDSRWIVKENMVF